MKSSTANLIIDPTPQFDLSPYLFMQFMEPLGTTDGSVAAAWDDQRDCWREDVIAATKELAPTMMRWGGCLSSYYRWREGVGPRERRKPMDNLLWGGVETNQVGTHEFADFCRTVEAEALLTVNFESDGRQYWAKPAKGGIRSAGPAEAAAWVDYCNNPTNAARSKNGTSEPLGVRFWQIGNETSYDPNGYDCETTARRTLAFARAMRRADPTIKIIGWGDSGWAGRMLEVVGAELDYLAFHHHFDSGLPDSPLRGTQYRNDPELTWRHLMHAWRSTEARLQEMRTATGGQAPLALTESHFALPGRNRCEVLSSWAAGAANARILNTHARHGDVLKIATLADFCGTRWMVNAVMIPTPQGNGRAYLMPVARVMALYRKYQGKRALAVTGAPAELDITASRTGSRIFLHVVNTSLTQTVQAKLEISGLKITSGKVHEIAPEPFSEIDETRSELFSPVERTLPAGGKWSFPPASVSAVELITAADGRG